LEWETYRERPGGVSRRCPAPATVQPEALVLDDLENAPATEGFRVGLALDLEDVEREEDDLADADKTGSNPCQPLRLNLYPTPIGAKSHLPAVECIMALPVFLPNALSKSLP
jgi:hypothetical protein